MSDTVLDISGAIVEAAQVPAVEAVQGAATHVGTTTSAFTFIWNGSTISFIPNSPFIADAGLYAALQASASPVAWSD